MDIHWHRHTYIYIHTHARTHARTRTHAHARTHARTHTHTTQQHNNTRTHEQNKTKTLTTRPRSQTLQQITKTWTHPGLPEVVDLWDSVDTSNRDFGGPTVSRRTACIRSCLHVRRASIYHARGLSFAIPLKVDDDGPSGLSLGLRLSPGPARIWWRWVSYSTTVSGKKQSCEKRVCASKCAGVSRSLDERD